MLNIADNGIGNKGLEFIADAIIAQQSLVYLNIENNNLTSKCLPSIKKLLGKLSSITDLRIGKNEIDD